jgi:hypothetical protein
MNDSEFVKKAEQIAATDPVMARILKGATQLVREVETLEKALAEREEVIAKNAGLPAPKPDTVETQVLTSIQRHNAVLAFANHMTSSPLARLHAGLQLEKREAMEARASSLEKSRRDDARDARTAERNPALADLRKSRRGKPGYDQNGRMV